MSKVTEVQIVPIKAKDGLIAFASLVLNGEIFISSIGIHTKLEGGFRITYPTKMVGGKNINIYHPINKTVSGEIEEAVISKYKEVIERNNDRYSSNQIRK